MKPARESWTIRFEDMPDEHNRPMATRIKQMLKHALRSCRLRCTSYSTSKPKPPQAEPEGQKPKKVIMTPPPKRE